MRDVRSETRVLRRGTWEETRLAVGSELLTVSVSAVDPDDPETEDDFWMTCTGFLTPTTLARGRIAADGTNAAAVVKSAPELFDAEGLEVTQHFAVSADGTRVPYFQVAPADLELDGANPVYLDGYGGFEVSRTPAYTPTIGLGWLCQTAAGGSRLPSGRRGVYVVANIRGGGEYGPRWHTAALRENRHRAYEDFLAVAQDLVERQVTSPEHLGCAGGSNGGLLVGNMLTRYPEHFGAVSCGVPLLDMRRYTKLSAGRSWVAEYGDPETSDWDFIQTFSPYHLLDSEPKSAYPPVLFWTASSDDRVGPVQARKMAAKMEARGIPHVHFYEDTAGGHSAAADNAQAARTRALVCRFLWKTLTE